MAKQRSSGLSRRFDQWMAGDRGSPAFGWRQVCELLQVEGRMRKLRRAPFGFEAEVEMRGRHAASTIMQNQETVAGTFRVIRVDAQAHPSDVSRATLRLISKDLLVDREGAQWPGLTAGSLSLRDPIEFGWDEFGEPVRLSVLGRHSVFAGETGSGKTVGQGMIAATAAIDPTVRLFVCDPNEMLWAWEPFAERYEVDDVQAIAEMFEFILAEHVRRNAIRRQAGLDKWSSELADQTGEGPIVLLVDEAPEVLLQKACRDQLRRVVLRTRISWVHVSMTIQAPNATIIDTPLRGQLGLRAVFRVADRPASQVALGTSVVDASQISASQRGVCYLHQDGLLPVRMRTFYPTPEQLAARVARAVPARPLPGRGDTVEFERVTA